MADHRGSEMSENSENYENRTDEDESWDAPQSDTTNKVQTPSDSSDFAEVGCFTPAAVLPPRMAHNPFAVKVGTPTRSMADSTEHKESRPILAPPTLVLEKCTPDTENSASCVTSTFRLKPPILNNPFLRVDPAAVAIPHPDSRDISTTDVELSELENVCEGQQSSTCGDDKGLETMIHDNGTQLGPFRVNPNESTGETSAIEDSETIEKTIFGPPIVATHSPAESSFASFSQTQPISSTSMSFPSNLNYAPSTQEFVFGQNMNERVTNINNSPFGTANGVDNLTFRVRGNLGSPKNDGACYDDGAKRLKSLTESALEYESRKVKRTYEEVAIVTGEEDESNVLQMNCKLFAFDKVTSSWAERGRGLLRLNDKEMDGGLIRSRIVARTQGSLRVVLNTKVWAGMSVDRPSPNSVRLTAMDGEAVKVFLVKAGPKDCDQLFGALDWRVTTLKSSEERRANDPLFFQTSITHSCGLLSVASGDETISSSATSPSLSPCSVGAAADISTIVAVEGTKKRRISPPSVSENDDSSCGVQERRVDSTECVDTDGSNHIFATNSPTI